MNRYFLVLPILLIINNIGLCQTVKLPEKLTVTVNRLTAISVPFEGDDIAFTGDTDVDVFREYGSDPKIAKIRVIVYKKTNGLKLQAIVTKDKKLSDFSVCILSTDSTPIPPDPVPVPVPPEPTDSLYLQLKNAWTTELAADKIDKKNKLAAIYRAGIEFVKEPMDKTQGELDVRMKTVIQKDVGPTATVLPNIRKILSDYMKANLTQKPSDPVDPRGVEVFTNIAKALEALK